MIARLIMIVFLCYRIIASFEEMTVKLAEEEDLLDPLIINTKNLAFRGQTVGYLFM